MTGMDVPCCRRHADDRGFTLVELTVTMVVVGTVLLALVAIQTRALVTTTEAKQRQQATAVGNQVMEQLRSLPFDALSRGMNPVALGGDPNIVGSRFRPPASPTIDETPVATSAGVTTLPPLAGAGGTNITSVADTATSSVTFSARAYTTRATAAAVDSPLWLSVVVTWSSGVTRGQTRSELFRSKAFAPKGCLSTANRPFSGPCQAFLYGDADVHPGVISVSNPVVGVPVLAGQPATSVSLTLAGEGAGIASEQTNSIQGRATSSSARAVQADVVLAGEGGEVATTTAGDDLGAGTAPVTSTADLAQSGGPLVVGGTEGTLTATASPADSGRTTSTARAAGTDCADLAGTAMSQQPCSNTTVLPSGVASITMDLRPVEGRDLAAFDLGRAAAPTAGSTAWVGRYVGIAGTSRCVVLTGPGCVASGARRVLGTTTTGTLPAAAAGDTVAALPEGLVRVTGYSDEATTESGPSSTAVASGFARTGSVRYWTGAGYGTLTLSPTTDTTITLGSAQGTYLTASARLLTVAVTGTMTVKPRLARATTPDAACLTACTKEATMPSVLTVLSYAVTLDGAPVAAFDVVADLGSSVASTSYQAAPGA